MPDVGFGSGTNKTTYTTKAGVAMEAVTIPEGRVHANGDRRVRVQAVGAWFAGRGGSRTGHLSLEDAQTSTFTVAAGTQAVNQGLHDLPDFTASPGERLRLSIAFPGGIYYAWVSGPTNTIDDNMGSIKAGTLAGAFRYAQAPQAPIIDLAQSDATGTRLDLRCNMNGRDDGGTAIASFRFQIATDSGFTQNVKTIVTQAMTQAFVGLTPGSKIYARVAAQNGVTTTIGTPGGQWADTKSVVMNDPNPGVNGMIRTATGWVPMDGKIYTSSGWKPIDGRIRTAAGWVPFGVD